MVLGSGEYTYRAHDGQWGDLPEGWNLIDVAGVAVDDQDRVFVCNRGAHPVIMLDRDGRFLGSWGRRSSHARIHKYAPDGTYLFSWGASGVGEGEFSLPHNIACDADGWIYVADRENHRIQIFDGDGRFETQWHAVKVSPRNEEEPS